MADKLITTQNDRTNAPQTSYYSTNDRSTESQFEQEAKTSADEAKAYRDAAQAAKAAAETAQAGAEAAEAASEVNADVAQTAQAAADDASTSAGQASAAELKAKQWAGEAEDVAVETGLFSARHHALKADASAAAAGTSETNAASSASSASTSASNAATSESTASASASAAATSESNASASESKAQQWADANEDVEVETGLYSAKHWAKKAEQITSGARQYQGTHDASGGSYPIASPSSGDEGKYWLISVAGTLPAGSVVPGDELAISASLAYEIISQSSVYMQKTNNLSDLGNVAAARSNLGLGSAALVAASSYGATLMDDADAATARGTLGLGTAAIENTGTGPNQMAKRDASGNIPGNITGNAATASSATKLAIARNIDLGGDVSGSAGFDGSTDINITVTVGNDSHLHTLSTISDAGTAAARNIGAGASDLADNSQLNTRLGTSGNLGSMATKTATNYLAKSEFDPSNAGTVWSGSTTAPIPMSSLSQGGAGLYVLRDNNDQEISVYVRSENETALGGAKGISASTSNLEIIWAIYQPAGFAIVGASVTGQFASAKTVTAIYKV